MKTYVSSCIANGAFDLEIIFIFRQAEQTCAFLQVVSAGMNGETGNAGIS